MKKNKLLFLSMLFLVVAFTMGADAAYLCDDGECMMLVEQYSNGYSWQIDCPGGQTSGGWIEGGTYGGDCPQIA